MNKPHERSYLVPLTDAEVDAHIGYWEARLAQGSYPHRRQWPSRLFHHAPLENAVSIIRDGHIRARNDPANVIPRDVAGPGVIALRDDAHQFVRFYFRPRTPTQFHIEGVRKPEDCTEFGVHAPILVMFIFRAKPILTAVETRFSDENMQRGTALVGDDYAFFQSIPFDKVYHEGGLCGDRSIIAHRCAEVLARTPIPLEDNLQWIYCRSEAERQTLLFKLGEAGHRWQDRIRVSEDIKVFHRLLCYVEHVHLSEAGITFELHPRNDGKLVSIEISVQEARSGQSIIEFKHTSFSPYPKGGKRWYTAGPLRAGMDYLARIELEGHEAFQAALNFGDTLL